MYKANDFGFQITTAVTAFYLTFVLIPLCCYWIFQLYRHRKQMFVVKRNVAMTFVSTISYLLWILLFDVCLFSMWFNVLWMMSVSFLMLFPIIGTVGYCLSCKTWMAYYNYKWTYYTLEVQWSSIINSTSHITNWYLQNRKTYGNWTWMSKFLGVLFIIALSLFYVAALLIFSGNVISTIIGILMFCIPLTCIGVVYRIVLHRTPNLQKLRDRFFIHWEAKLIGRLTLVFSIVTMLMFTISGLVVVMFESLRVYVLVVACVVFPSMSAAVIYTSTIIIIDKNRAVYGDEEAALENMDYRRMSNVMIASLRRMVAILANKDALHLFMLHLSHEYSMEVLLSFIEFSQYLDYLKTLDPKQIEEASSHSSMEDDELNSLLLSDSVPISSIVGNTEEDHGFKQKAHQLFCKYIARGSEYEINISGRLRNQCAHLMQNDQVFLNANVIVSDIEPLFKQCNQELLRYLSYSHSRFAKTEEYAAVLKIITPPDS
eukprot:189079_1